MRLGLKDYFKCSAAVDLHLVRSVDLFYQIIHKLQSQCFGVTHIHIIGKSNASISNNHGVSIQIIIQLDLDISGFAIRKGMFESIRYKLVYDQSTRDGFIDVQIILTHIQLQLDLFGLPAEHRKKMIGDSFDVI